MSLDSLIIYCTCGSLRLNGNNCIVCAILGPVLPPTKEVNMTANLKMVTTEIVGKEAAKVVR